jgi:hypothetical protein
MPTIKVNSWLGWWKFTVNSLLAGDLQLALGAPGFVQGGRVLLSSHLQLLQLGFDL